jgi:hypothetical protein
MWGLRARKRALFSLKLPKNRKFMVKIAIFRGENDEKTDKKDGFKSNF